MEFIVATNKVIVVVLLIIIAIKAFSAHAPVANIHYIKDPSGETVCMDGSKPAFYLHKGNPNNKWIVFFNGIGMFEI